MVPLRREERTACFAPSFSCFSFLFNMWMCTCDVRMSAHSFPHRPFFPPFCLCPHFSKPFPRKKNRVQIACCILFWCVCVCQLLPQLMFYCLLLCVKPDDTVYCSLLTTHYVYRRMSPPPPPFFFPCLFLRVPAEEWKLLN